MAKDQRGGKRAAGKLPGKNDLVEVRGFREKRAAGPGELLISGDYKSFYVMTHFQGTDKQIDYARDLLNDQMRSIVQSMQIRANRRNESADQEIESQLREIAPLLTQRMHAGTYISTKNIHKAAEEQKRRDSRRK